MLLIRRELGVHGAVSGMRRLNLVVFVVGLGISTLLVRKYSTVAIRHVLSGRVGIVWVHILIVWIGAYRDGVFHCYKG